MNVAKCAFSLLFAGVLMHIINVSLFTLNNYSVEPLCSIDYSDQTKCHCKCGLWIHAIVSATWKALGPIFDKVWLQNVGVGCWTDFP